MDYKPKTLLTPAELDATSSYTSTKVILRKSPQNSTYPVENAASLGCSQDRSDVDLNGPASFSRAESVERG